MDNNPLDLEKGELITCENAHPFGRVIRDCTAGVGDWVDAIDWLQYHPAEGGSCICNACGARWILIEHLVGDIANKRARICVAGVWRPELDETDLRHLAGEDIVGSSE